MESVDIEGDSIDDAIARALQRLGVSRDKVEIEIVSNATRGLFGFGGKRARVRARLRAARPQDGAAATPASDLPAPPAVERRETPARAPAPPVVAAPPPAPARRTPVDAGRSAPPPRPQPSNKPPTRPARPQRQAQPPKPRPERSQPPARVPSAPPPRPAVPPSPELIARGQSVLDEVVRHIGLEAPVRVETDADGTRLVIDGDADGVLIGRRGQTLDAIEYVVNRIVGHDEDSPTRLVVDVQGYRARRREALEALAQRMAERARQRGKPVTLNPMSPRDRRIVHLALQGDPTLTTRSAGSGHYRKLVIVPNRK